MNVQNWNIRSSANNYDHLKDVICGIHIFYDWVYEQLRSKYNSEVIISILSEFKIIN